jgi:hypothetical protein
MKESVFTHLAKIRDLEVYYPPSFPNLQTNLEGRLHEARKRAEAVLKQLQEIRDFAERNGLIRISQMLSERVEHRVKE